MSTGLIGIGLSGLAAAQAGMNTTSENISNVNTPGYTRESIIQVPSDPIFSGGGYLGQGTQVTTVTRSFNQYQQQELVQAQAASSQLDTNYSQIQQIDNLLGNSSGGLDSAMNTFFSATQALANNPSDVPTRQTMLSDAQSLADSFNGLGDQLQQMSANVNQQVAQSITTVNSQAQQLAALNEKIATASGGTTGQQPNALLDQRDALVQQLNSEIGATTIAQSDGSLNVFIGNGQPLVLGNTTNTLTTVSSAADPNRLQLAVQSGSATALIGTNQLQGGSLSGLLTFRDQSLVPAQNALGRIAINLADAVNAQNELGQTLNGTPGGPLFSTGGTQVTANASNTGTATVSAAITDPTQLTTANYRLQKEAGQYVVTNLSDQSQQSFASLPQTVDGVTLSATAGMANGDSFTIDPTVNGATQFALTASDPWAIAAAAPVRAMPGAANVGSASVANLAVVGPPPTNVNLQQPINILFHVVGATTTYDVVDAGSGTVLSAGQPYSPNTPIAFNGWSLSLSGTPSNGDTVSVGPNTSGTLDNTNALLLAGLQSKSVVGNASLSGAYQQLVGQIGSQTAELQSTSQAQDGLLTQAQQTVDSSSGVNLDEEAANLLKYQQAYQAASQTIATANSMFASIIGLFANMP